MPEVKVTIFSAGINTRNIELVCHLWKIAAARGTRVRRGNILSREHLSKQSGNNVKDISKTLSGFERLSNCVLADDLKLNRARGQKKNFLHIPMTDHANFERLSKLEQDPDDERYLLLSCYITEKYDSHYVREGCYIDVCKSDDGYKVYFLNKDTYKLCKTKLTQANHPRLVGLLNACPIGKLEHPVLLKAIRGLVARKNGKFRRLFLEVNRIYYLVGIVFMAIKISHATKITLTKALYQLQHCKFKQRMIKKKTEICEEFYHLGLALLKQINPNLSFMTQIEYMNTVSRTAENSEDLTWSDI